MSGSVASVFIDEVDVTDYALSGSSTRRLNRPSIATVTLPYDAPYFEVGTLLKVYFDGVLHHHGRILQREVDTDESYGQVIYNSTDPLELWAHRPVRDPDGDFTNPTLIADNVTGPQIVEAMMTDSETAGAGPPADAEGPLYVEFGGFALGGVDLTGTPTDWPMSMAELAALLISTGEVDVICTPIELTDSGYVCDPTDPSFTPSSSADTVYNYGRIDVYNGDFGLDLSTAVSFEYATGLKNVRAIRWNDDMTSMCNKLWYYLGPRINTQHWWANIVGTASAEFASCSANEAAVQAQALASRCLYGTRMEIRTYDDRNDEAQIGMCLFVRQWLIEAWLRAIPLRLLHVTPTRDTEIGTFDIGDLVGVEVDASILGGLSGSQRVYQYSIGWDSESVCALSELQVSSDAEGFTA